jgi:hypothetical protein
MGSVDPQMLLMLHDMNSVQKPFFALWTEQMSGRLSVAPVLSIGPIGRGGRGGRNLMIPISPMLLSRLFLFYFWLFIYIYIYSQISMFVIKSAKIMCFLRFSIARI